MSHTLKDSRGRKFSAKIPTYREIVMVKDGVAIVELDVTRDILLRRGFEVMTEPKAPAPKESKAEKPNKATKKSSKKKS